jgi:hypothetical protein
MRYLIVFIVFFVSVLMHAQAADAPYVTTPQNVVDAMLSVSAVKADDYVVDLGSGDGRIVITAAQKLGARGMGVELDANLVRSATREAQRAGVHDRASFVSDDLFFADLGKGTVITLYLGAAVNQRLRPALLKLKAGTRVVSHDFDMGNWQPDEKLTLPVPGKSYGAPRSDIFLWVVPADFSGTWSWRQMAGGIEQAHQALLAQKFQKAEAQGRIAQSEATVSKLDIRGDTIRFVMAARDYQGRIAGDTISGTAVTIGAGKESVPWRATRSARGTYDIEAGAQSFGSGFNTKE